MGIFMTLQNFSTAPQKSQKNSTCTSTWMLLVVKNLSKVLKYGEMKQSDFNAQKKG